jgi:hypothetical protein
MTTPTPIEERGPGPLDRDPIDRCWWGSPSVGDDQTGERYPASWTFGDEPFPTDTHWLPAGALPLLHPLSDDREQPDSWLTHPSLTAEQRNPSLCR